MKSNPASIQAAVVQEVLEYHDIIGFFSELLRNGCQSGMINRLIYYSDTHKFFDEHYAEIEDLRYDLEQSLGLKILVSPVRSRLTPQDKAFQHITLKGLSISGRTISIPFFYYGCFMKK